MPSVKKNFVYSSIITLSNYIFPLLTFPYVSRVLGVSNIGICNFVDSIIHYFIYISMMGITAVGIREIALNKDDDARLSKTFTSLALINCITTVIAAIALVICIHTVPKFQEYRDLLYVGVLKLVGNALLIDWLYKGLEDFKYITKRTLLVKTLYVICVFVFIRNADDYKIYYLLSVLMIAVNALFNIIYSRRLVSLDFRSIEIKKYLKPFLVMGFYILITSMYTSFNVLYLGFVTNDVQVGYYTVSHKLYTLIIAVFGAFTGVMLPRMSSMIAEGNLVGFRQMIKKSIDILFTFAFPVVICAVIFSPQIIQVLSGDGYEGAFLPTRIMMPLIFIIGYEQILVHQILMPLKYDKVIFINSIIGALVGIALNLILVSKIGAVGSSITWLLSEIAVFVFAQIQVARQVGIAFPFKRFMQYLLCYLPSIVFCLVYYKYVHTSDFITLIIIALFMLFYTLLVQIRIIKNEHVLQITDKFIRFIR